MDKRKVLFTSGMTEDFIIIITDATKEDIEKQKQEKWAES